MGEGIKGGTFEDVWMHKVKKAKWSEERGKRQPVKQEIKENLQSACCTRTDSHTHLQVNLKAHKITSHFIRYTGFNLV